MSYRFCLLGLALLLSVTLSGCSNYSASHEYYKARPEAKLEIPPGLDRPVERLDMTLPVVADGTTTYSSYSGNCTQDPSTLKMVALQDLSVVREGDFIWLHANTNPEQLWQPTRSFLKKKGFGIARDDDDLGILESGWFEYQEDGHALRDKYRLRFEFGKTAGSSDIYLSLRGERLSGGEWQPRETDVELEIEMLKRLARYLGDSEVEFSEVPTAETEVALHDRGKKGGLSLVINHGFDEAWRRTIRAIEKSGNSVEERSINQRFLIARFDDKSEAAKARQSSWMGNVLTPSDKHAVGRYRIEFFIRDENSTEIQLQNQQGKVTSSERAKRVISELEQALSE